MSNNNPYQLEIFIALFYSILLTMGFWYCFSPSSNTIASNKTKLIKETPAKQKQIKPNEILVVVPSQKQLDSLKKAMNNNEYNTLVDESTFFINQAKEYSPTNHSKIVEVVSGTPVLFKTEKGEIFPIKTHNLLWDIIVFNEKTGPERIDVTNVQTEMIRVYNEAKQHNQILK